MTVLEFFLKLYHWTIESLYKESKTKVFFKMVRTSMWDSIFIGITEFTLKSYIYTQIFRSSQNIFFKNFFLHNVQLNRVRRGRDVGV